MPDEPKETAAPEKPAAAKGAAPPAAETKTATKGGNPALLAGIVAGALALGAATGSMLIAPKISAARGAKKPVASEESQNEQGKGKEPAKRAVFKLDNLIVNPAGSQGARFLMASVAIDVPNDKTEARLREREVQVRDVVMSTLESETLEMLTRPGARDSLKNRILRVVMPLAGTRDIHVYLPQYVIQ